MITYLKCKNNKKFSASYTSLSKKHTVPSSSYFLTKSTRFLNNRFLDSDSSIVNSSTACILSQYTNIKQRYKQQVFTSNTNNNNTLSSYYIDRPISRSILNFNNFEKNLYLRKNLFLSSYNINDNEDSFSSINKSQIRRCSNKFNGSNVYNYTQSTSNLSYNNDKILRSYYQKKGYLNKKDDEDDEDDDYEDDENEEEYSSNSPDSSNSSDSPNSCNSRHHQHHCPYHSQCDSKSFLYSSSSNGLQHLQELENQLGMGSKKKLNSSSLIDSLNLDFVSMENMANEKILQKQNTSQSLLYNLDLFVSGSLFSVANTSVNSLFSKKTITSYILISSRPIFSVMQKCLIEMYLLTKYSLQRNQTLPTTSSSITNNTSTITTGIDKNKNSNNQRTQDIKINLNMLKKGIMESFVAYLMHTVFLPSINSPFIVEIELPLSKELLQIKPHNKIQIQPVYHPLFLVFQMLSISNIISIFTHMTLEKSVIFYSENPSVLTSIW
ncbi:hypothetical protein BCR32DRAFT_265560 [Anaeromyces robustus]|uniref:cDENN domain-containing protein n=1 Tax=Anaeromyces robustus TaxID=1754192 RepID=A0A1Y1XIL4_9FUNG|nr:hypothetical protein BCR32DRAFT_265560 [Anaeromyces robustus]|eukprot:ORX85608.1 hypothetical protein BCR32DRAFT_265560 [Anaeromyces robustus]